MEIGGTAMDDAYVLDYADCVALRVAVGHVLQRRVGQWSAVPEVFVPHMVRAEAKLARMLKEMERLEREREIREGRRNGAKYDGFRG